MWKHIRNLSLIVIVLAIGVIWYYTRPDKAQLPLEKTEGVTPELSVPRPEKFPTIDVASVTGWAKGETPLVPEGYAIAAYARGLDHPRSLYRMPNGDILVAETNSPPRPDSGIRGWIMRTLMGRVGAGGTSANRITLLRDANKDGVPETRSVFLTGLNSPFGMALVGSTFYVANTDAVMAFPYQQGALKITDKGRKIYELSATAPNNHWTRNLEVSRDGKKLYIAVGSSTNIAENGLKNERYRAMVIEYDIAEDKGIPWSAGLRNPVGLDWNPATGELWTVVNERDMLGSDLVPDYLTRAEWGTDYGWPHHYFGGHTDGRVQPEKPEKRQYERWPDYALGAHVAPLGLLFNDGKLDLGSKYASGAFIARHGSWNRSPKSGYDVVFVAFDANGKPVGKPMPFVTGFLNKDEAARGRPVMLERDATGALLVSDDVGNVIWRITRKSAAKSVKQPSAD